MIGVNILNISMTIYILQINNIQSLNNNPKVFSALFLEDPKLCNNNKMQHKGLLQQPMNNIINHNYRMSKDYTYLALLVVAKHFLWIYFMIRFKLRKRLEFISMNLCLMYKKIFINVPLKKILLPK